MRTTLILALALVANLTAAPIPDAARDHGLAIGCQAYTFKEFTAFEAIAKTKEAGGKTIEFYPGQKLRPGSDETVIHTASAATVQALKDECARQGIFSVNYGVVDAKDAGDIRKIMEFAKTMGLYSVCTESTELVAEWEKAVKEYDIRVAFHEHHGSMANPNYKVWNPLYIRGVVESRDPRIGACADLGHWCTSGLKPVECLRILNGRIISVHLKDKASFGNAAVVPAGKGVADIAACVAELKKQGFNGHMSVEYEADWQNNVPGVKETIAFAKAEWAK